MSNSENTRRKILVVDDEPSIVKYLDALLRDNGYETLTAANGNEAMERTRSDRPDLICLDITMPEKSGIRFYRELKEDPELASIPVVIVTAVSGYGGDPEPFKNFLNTRRQIPPPEEFISKPIDRDAFLEVLGRVLG
jgi:CheY-like chemotaxis protein